MGSSFTYKCQQCGYEGTAADGVQHGMAVTKEGMVCFDCKELVEIVKEADSRVSAEQCPLCQGGNLGPFYDKRRRCPKCNSRMDKTGEVLWD